MLLINVMHSSSQRLDGPHDDGAYTAKLAIGSPHLSEDVMRTIFEGAPLNAFTDHYYDDDDDDDVCGLVRGAVSRLNTRAIRVLISLTDDDGMFRGLPIMRTMAHWSHEYVGVGRIEDEEQDQDEELNMEYAAKAVSNARLVRTAIAQINVHRMSRLRNVLSFLFLPHRLDALVTLIAEFAVEPLEIA